MKNRGAYYCQMKSMYLKKPKKLSRKVLKERCDDLFSKKVRSIGYCQAEGADKKKCGGQLQCCHIEARDNHRLRWSPENCLCMCYTHHRTFHHHPLHFVEFVQEHYPEKWRYVMEHKNEKATDIDYEALYTMIKDWKLYELA